CRAPQVQRLRAGDALRNWGMFENIFRMPKPRRGQKAQSSVVSRRFHPFFNIMVSAVTAIALSACDERTSTSAEGFAGLGQAAGEFAPVVRGQPLEFPRDHGAHDGYRIGWWYITANLVDEAGRDWGMQWTLFR